jgi:hypothetical protein
MSTATGRVPRLRNGSLGSIWRLVQIPNRQQPHAGAQASQRRFASCPLIGLGSGAGLVVENSLCLAAAATGPNTPHSPPPPGSAHLRCPIWVTACGPVASSTHPSRLKHEPGPDPCWKPLMLEAAGELYVGLDVDEHSGPSLEVEATD